MTRDIESFGSYSSRSCRDAREPSLPVLPCEEPFGIVARRTGLPELLRPISLSAELPCVHLWVVFPCRPNRMREFFSRVLRVVRYLSAGRAASIRLCPGFRNRMSLAVSQAQSCGFPLSATYERAGSIKKFTSATICGRGESYLTTSRQSGFPVRRPGVHSVPMEVVNRTPARSRPPTSCCPCRPRSSRPSAKPSRRRSDAWVRRSWRYRRGRSRTPASRRYSLRG